MHNDTMDGIGEKRARSGDFDEISAYDVLTTLKRSNPNLRKNEHDLDLSVAPVKFKLTKSGSLEKDGDIYFVHDDIGISFIIRRIDDKRLDVREAKTSLGYKIFQYMEFFPYTGFWYVDIDRGSNNVKIKSINDDVHDPKVMEDLFRQYLK
jgi:hypothetical protein